MYPVVTASNLQKSYNGFAAVKGIDFKIFKGQCFGILGPNGAGKTTIVAMIYCFHPLSGGNLKVLGRDVNLEPREIKARLGVVPQDNNLDQELTVRENLLVYASYYGINKKLAKKRAEELLRFFGLLSKADQQVEQISGGMKRRLTIARGLIHTPEILILDEPTTGLDPQSRRLIWAHLRQLKKEGLTLVLTTHYMEEASQLCDDLIIMDRGKILKQGRPDRLIEEEIGNKVVEVEIDLKYADDFLTGVKPEIGGYQMAGSTVYLFIQQDESDAVNHIVNSPYVETYRVRQSNLEDVFLKLTGRGLIYEEDAARTEHAAAQPEEIDQAL